VQRLTFEAEQQFAQRAIDAYHKIKAQRTP
jgi:hypothetical protein